MGKGIYILMICTVSEIIEQDCSHNPSGEYRDVINYVEIPDKNDGVVNIHSALWSKNDVFDGPNNIYMKDVNITPRGDDGGYNHFELRNYARAYTLEENGQEVFSEGDENPSMQEARLWLDEVLKNL